ncbi:polysaccharide biosynthesis protein [Citroniella saccharovorans]|uniref:polysaccharide biosynthesis protein n=1 Tax=Citroniella saccharovorans TaxID=2053367 RepID=UPI0036182AC0
MNIILSVIFANIITIGFLIFSASKLPRSTYPIVLLTDLVFIGGVRLFPKILRAKRLEGKVDVSFKNTLIIGAGEAGILVLKELKKHPELGNVAIGFIDDDERKRGKLVSGVEVLGSRDNIPDIVKRFKVDEIILAMPAVSQKDQKSILEICSKTGAKVRLVPGIYEMIDGKINLKDIREIQIDDLLGREEIKLNLSELQNLIENKVILVTGGGGSIGSELARQIAKHNPKTLILLDIYENTTYDIQNELKRQYKDLDLVVLIESIRDRKRLDQVFAKYKPNVIFHAAAHKHVPLMEDSPHSAVKNNVFGTLNTVLEADHHGVEKFVLISTDKAVNPTNVMGCTKRICEMIVQSFNKISKTDYVAVRFGNVLGSNGSVIPLFLKQINEGGPVTLTDKNIIRYFMSIPEAAQLVLQAGAIGKGGEVFVLDMGEPVKILDLAEKLIRLHGLKPYEDIDIKVIGLRPGEKLYEELLLDLSKVDKTSHDRIYVEKPSAIDFFELEKKLLPLKKVLEDDSREEIVEELEKIVPTFKNYIPDKKNKK